MKEAGVLGSARWPWHRMTSRRSRRLPRCGEARDDLTRARELLDRAAATSPEADVTLPRAKLLAHYGRYLEALGVVDSLKELSGEGQLTRGKILEHLNRYDEAWQDFVAAKRKLAAEGGGLQYDAVEAPRTLQTVLHA